VGGDVVVAALGLKRPEVRRLRKALPPGVVGTVADVRRQKPHHDVWAQPAPGS
jgi:hypothetical protein